MKFEEYLKKNDSLTYYNVGTSMMPLLKQGRDLFTVEKKTGERCKKYDVVLYRRPPAKYVLHRIVEVRENDYVILGDNCIRKEYGIRDEDILGVMTSFVRKGHLVKCNNRFYRIYSVICVAAWPLRKILYPVKALVKKILQPIL